MNLLHSRRLAQHLMAAALSALLLVSSPSAIAAPGAHGPNGEHLDGPVATRAASALPRVEATSEAFELVAELRPGELAIVVDGFQTNEPVLGAKLEVESGSLKAVATFRAEQGDYAVTDASLLKALAAPGEHGLVFTLVAGQESDLLDGTLIASADGVGVGVGVGVGQGRSDHAHVHADDDHGHAHELEHAAWIVAGVAVLALIGGIAWRRRNRLDTGKQQGGL